MPIATVSSKHQMTLPIEIIRAMDIKPGDKLVVELMDNRIVAVREPQDWVQYMYGSAKGAYGETKEDMDRYVAEERAAWQTYAHDDPEAFADYYVAHEGETAQRVLDVLLERPHHAADAASIASDLGLSPERVKLVIDQEMVPQGWVRRIVSHKGTIYRLRSGLATTLGAACGVARPGWTSDLGNLKRIAFDTNALIYFFEGHEQLGPLVREALWRVNRGLAVGVISTIVELELLVKPLRDGDTALIDRLGTFFRNGRNLVIRPIDRDVAQAAAKLRAAARLQVADSIVGATAAVEGCDAIIGNDHRFARRMSSVQYLYLDSYVS